MSPQGGRTEAPQAATPVPAAPAAPARTAGTPHHPALTGRDPLIPAGENRMGLDLMHFDNPREGGDGRSTGYMYLPGYANDADGDPYVYQERPGGPWHVNSLPGDMPEQTARTPQELMAKVARLFGIHGEMRIDDEREGVRRSQSGVTRVEPQTPRRAAASVGPKRGSTEAKVEARRAALAAAVQPFAMEITEGSATIDGVAGEIPAAVTFHAQFADADAAQAFVDTMPRSARMNVSGTYVSASVDNAPNGVRGDRNETGLKRYRAIIAALAEAGVDVQPRRTENPLVRDRAHLEEALTGLPLRPRDPDRLRANAPFIARQQAEWDAAMERRRSSSTGPGAVAVGATDADRRAARPRLEISGQPESDRAYEIRTAPSRDAALRLLNGHQLAGLRAFARAEGVVTSGTKKDLVARLIRVLRDRHEDSTAITRMVNQG